MIPAASFSSRTHGIPPLQELLQSVLTFSMDMIFVVNREYKVILFNSSASHIIEHRFDKKINLGDSILEFMPKPFYLRILARCFQNIPYQQEVELCSGENKLNLEICYNPIIDEDGIINNIIISARDISEKVQLRRKLIEEEIATELLVKKTFIDAQEMERKKLAHELHDNVQQLLATCKLYMNSLDVKKKENIELLEKANETIDLSVLSINQFCQSLQPTEKKEYDLLSEIGSLIHTQGLRKNDIVFKFEHAKEEIISLDYLSKIHVYRIIQETTSNIIKHAKATRVNVLLHSGRNGIDLTIKDNGKGFDPEKVKKGIGLASIRDRIAALNGKFKLTSAEKKGTKWEIHIPSTGWS